MQGLSVPHSSPSPRPQITPTLKLWPFMGKHHQHSLTLSAPSPPGFRQNRSRRRNDDCAPPRQLPALDGESVPVEGQKRRREHGILSSADWLTALPQHTHTHTTLAPCIETGTGTGTVLPRGSTMGPPKPSMQALYAGPADWESQRETITRLYLHEKRSLQEVMEFMALEHSFFATCDPMT